MASVHFCGIPERITTWGTCYSAPGTRYRMYFRLDVFRAVNSLVFCSLFTIAISSELQDLLLYDLRI